MPALPSHGQREVYTVITVAIMDKWEEEQKPVYQL